MEMKILQSSPLTYGMRLHSAGGVVAPLRKSIRHHASVARVASPARDSFTARDVDKEHTGAVFTTSGRPLPTDNIDAGEPAHADKPGTKDDSLFPQHWSVGFWRDFRIPEGIRDESVSLTQRVQNTVNALQEGARTAGVFDSPQALAYWTYHLPRMGFFAVNGLAGAAISSYQSRSSSGWVGNSMGDAGNTLDLARMLRFGIYVPFSEALAMFYQDYQNIRNGVYKMPWDMVTPGHRQLNPGYVLGKVSRFLTEASSAMQRRNKSQPENVWMDSNMYPDYYLNTWHYQTDGWLSDKSAAVYETSTETVFVGRQDAMQRQSLVPMVEFMKENNSKDGAGFQMLDIATGTGRFATFVKDNFPKMGITQLDLSPFYLARARENMDYWRRRRGGDNPETTVASKDKFLHAPAEKVPVPDASYDVVLATYLFHEIPDESRVQAAKEMVRACKPGGMVILNDGLQYGDRPTQDKQVAMFQAFNEPNWGTHMRIDYGKLFSDLGLVPHKKILASSSKILSWKKMPQN